MIVAIMTTALSGTAWAETKVLTFDLTSNPGSWPTANSTTLTNYTYTLNSVNYTFALKNVKCNSGYLMMTSTAVLGLPAIEGYKLTKVVASNSNGCSTSTRVGVSSSSSSASYITGGAYQTWSTTGSSYTYNLTSTSANTMYYLYVTNKNAQVTNLELTYESTSSSTCVTPTFDPVEGTYASAKDVTISTTTTGATIYYTTDGSTPTTSSSTYSSAITVSSNKTIKAMAVKANYTDSDVATATYTFVSLAHEGTQEDPYTVADARNAIDALDVTPTNVFATGIVSNIVEAYSSQHSNITFDISTDGETTSDQLRAYRCGGTDAASIQVGDVVVVSGDLTLYGSTYEFSSGCTLISRTSSSSKVAAGFSFSSNSAEADLADLSSFTAPTFSNPNNVTVTFTSSDPAVATVAQDGTVTPLAKGTTTITATSEETSEYLAGEAHYTLTVTNSNVALVTVDANGNTTFDFTDNAWGFPTTKRIEEGSYTNSGYTVKVAGAGTNNGFEFYEGGSNLLFGKNGAYLTLPAFDYDVEKIEVVGASGASESVVQNIYVGDEAVSTATTGATGTNTYMIAEAYKAAGNVYTLKVTSAHNSQVTSIKVYKAAPDNRTPVTLTFTGVPATIVKDETATYAVTASPAVTGITYSSSDGDVVMVDENTGEIGAIALGTATITATFAGDDDYKPATASYEIEVVAPTHTVTFFVNGVEQTGDEAEVSEGAAITFPATPADIDGKTFVGWTTAAIEGTTDTAPTIVTSAKMGTADVTYYAVFAIVTSGGSSQESLEITASTEGVPSSYGTANTFTEYTLEGVKFQIQQMYINGGKLQWRASGNANGTGTMYNSESLGKIESIVLTYNSSDNNKNFTLKVGNSANPTEGETITPSSSDEVYTFDCSSFNYGFFVLTNGSGAGYVDNIVINYSASSITYSAYCTTVAPATESVTVTAAGYATFASTNALDFTGKDIKAYIATANGTEGVNFTQINKVPANTGVLLVGTEGQIVNAEVPRLTGNTDATTGNVFVPGTGAAVASEGTDVKNYVLSSTTTYGVGFYPASDKIVAVGKAYISVPKTTLVKGFIMLPGLDDDATGISLMEDGRSQMEDGAIYNIAGQRISKMQKGINIVNGKKILK